MFNKLTEFARNEEGAITVDWVVLTAAICALGFAVVVSIHGSTGNVGDAVGNWFAGRTVGD